jgi:tRNA G46 methylase TrmB
MDLKLFEQTEKEVSKREGSYSNLSSEALLTSIADFQRIFESVEIESWCELGAGYGLGTLLFSQLYPDKKSYGIEFEAARVQYAIKEASQKNSSAHFIHADLLDCDIPLVQTYFFYFPTGPVLDRILFELGSRL